MGFPTTPEWASSKNYFWHSNTESSPLCRKIFDKCIARRKTNLAFKIVKGEAEGDYDLARRTIRLYDNDNANMFSGRTAETLSKQVLLDALSIEEAIENGAKLYADYVPRTWDDGKDAAKLEINRDEYAEVVRCAVEGVQEAAGLLGINRLTGETDVFCNLPGAQLPYFGKPDFSKQIELKTKWSGVNQRAKSGKRSSSLPTQPTWSHLAQVSGYKHGSGRPQAIVYVNHTGYRVFTAENCDLLTDDGMDNVLKHVAAKCRIRERLLQAAGSVEDLIGMIEPDFGHMWAWDVHPDVLNEAKQLWGFK